MSAPVNVDIIASRLLCPRCPPLHKNGKEGVNGSSPLEGFAVTGSSPVRHGRQIRRRS